MSRVFIAAGIVVSMAATAPSLIAQPSFEDPDRQAAYDIVQSFFDAMATSDSTLMASILMTDGIYYALSPTDTAQVVRRGTNEQFLSVFAAWDPPIIERMWNPTVLINDNLAVVWGPYDLYIGPEFSHCGTDAFTLIRTDTGWKISGVSYTVETTNCELHPDGPPSG